jgi:hypothetical protein
LLITWRIDPLLGKDLETNNETTGVAMQRYGKHASTTIELRFETLFSTHSVQRGYLEDDWCDPVSVTGVSGYEEKRRGVGVKWLPARE